MHAATFMYENIILRLGCPKILVSDRGSHFLNELFEEMTVMFQINHRKTTSYHSQTNDQTERVNGILVSILRKTILDSKRDVRTRKHQRIRIDRSWCLFRVFPGDLSIVQGFCEV